MKWPFLDYLSFPQPVVGVDEAGRGCLAGPVFAGAVILNFPQKFKDSKLLNPKQRENFAEEIKRNHRFAVGMASLKEIEDLNIHHASLLAMERAVEQLDLCQAHILIDGRFSIERLSRFSQTAVIKGDRRVYPISAAGILAKTERDKFMSEYAEKYPQYGFAKHKGYATKKHKEAIKKYGPCSIHRRSFAGVREYS